MITDFRKSATGQSLPVIFLIIVAGFIRYSRTNIPDFYLLAGSDGPYFCLQVKYLLMHGRLAMPDMPLLFIVGAGLARGLQLMHFGSIDECIALSVRIIDIAWPPLAAIPLFLIARELRQETGKSKWSDYLMTAFAILSFTPIFIFSFQLQKNAAAIVWIFFYFYFLLRILRFHQRKDYYKASIILLACTLTHFGSTGLLLFSTAVIVSLQWVFKPAPYKIPHRQLLLAPVIIACILWLIFIFDPVRFSRLMHMPLRLFEAPVLLYALQGQKMMLQGPVLIVVVFNNLMAIAGLCFLWFSRRSLPRYQSVAALAFALCAIFLSNPLLGLEWANRLFMIAYIPLTLLYLIIFNAQIKAWFRLLISVGFAVMLLFTITLSIFNSPFISIDAPAFAEFKKLNGHVSFQTDDAIVGRQDLRLLASWSFQTKGIADYLLTKKAYHEYHAVYYINQNKGKNSSLRESPFTIPDTYIKTYTGDFFEVYKISSDSDLPDSAQKIFKGIRGTVVRYKDGSVLVQDDKTHILRTVYLPLKSKQPIPAGSHVEVNGEWVPFSLAIRAATILVINKISDK